MFGRKGLTEERILARISVLLRLAMLGGLVVALVLGLWLTVLATAGILVLSVLPALLGRRFRVHIPHEFEALGVVFLFLSLFLGEVAGYYQRFWWWDALLHLSSGFLLGVMGFLLVYVLNQKEEIGVHMRSGFVAFFAFVFAVAVGAFWEIFEFAVDQIFGLNMQKSGITDTMWDLIADTVGALVIAILGFGYLCAPDEPSFLRRWIRRFVVSNPRLFGRMGPGA